MPITTHLSWKEAESFTPPPNSVLISIRDSDARRPFFKEGWVDILLLQFDDATEEDERHYSNPTLFTAEDADKIETFTEKYKHCDIITHCHAGISRSSAVCSYIHEAHGHTFALLPWTHPNPMIKKMLIRRLWEKLHGKEWK